MIKIYKSDGQTVIIGIIVIIITWTVTKPWSVQNDMIHSNMTLTFSHWACRQRRRVKICDKSRY